MRTANIVCAIVGMIFSSGAFIATLSFRKFKNVPVGPEFFPRYLAIGLFVCCVALLVQAIRTRPTNDKKTLTISLRGIQRLLIGLAIIVAYALCWELVGFIIVTPLALFALMFLLGLRRYPVMILFSFGAMLVIFCVFRFLLGIDMPLGILDGIL
jgi:putative tricarboxylic transport membrane protein